MSSFEISFFASLFSSLAMLPLKPKGERWRDVLRMRHPVLLLVRSFSALAATVLGIASLLTIPFAETYARLRQENEKLGQRNVRQKLTQKGVAAHTIDETLEARYANTDEEALARQHLERRAANRVVHYPQYRRSRAAGRSGRGDDSAPRTHQRDRYRNFAASAGRDFC